MKPTQALDGNNASAAEQMGCLVEGLIVPGQNLAVCIPELEMRSTLSTGIGLGVEAAIARVLVFGLASLAHDEAAHGRVGAVVRQGLNDAETRPAVRAVRERITVTPISRLSDILQTISASGIVGENEGGFCPASIARADLERGVPGRFVKGRLQRLDDGVNGLLSLETYQKSLQAPRRAFRFEQ
jgi:hypothetical protein